MTTPSIDRITLERTGQAPIAFTGSLIAEASGRTINAPAAQDNSDWWDISIYQTDAPESAAPYVVAINYTNDHRGRIATQQFASCTDDPAGVLGEYDPLSVLRGFPPGPQYSERQKHLEKNCRVQYDMLVSSVLKLFPEETAVKELSSEDRVSAACCSAMRMIRLLTLNAPSGILHAEIRNLTRLVNEACPSDAEQE